jgi:large subunit ribosomal protein L15
MQLHEIQREHKNKSKKTVGRGGSRGKTSGRGHKGQGQHGGTPRPAMRDILKKLPKLRGYKFNSINEKPNAVNLSDIERVYNDGEVVNPETLSAKKLLKGKKALIADVKILGTGTITKKITVEHCSISEAARAKITAVGGSVK